MRVSFDSLAGGRTYPLSRELVKRFLEVTAPPEIHARIARIHFGCNLRTTQEARIVARPRTFDVRINFWLEPDGTSRVVSTRPDWSSPVQRLGGVIERGANRVVWSHGAAQRYSAFLLAHEVAHAVYAATHGYPHLVEGKGGRAEERWCDRWAEEAALSFFPGSDAT